MSNDARCPKGAYCDFELLKDKPDAQVEVCTLCGKKVIYWKVGGKVDNKKYLEDHIRDFAQPLGATQDVFEEIYGRKYRLYLIEEAKKRKTSPAKMWEEIRAEMKETVEFDLGKKRTGVSF